MSLSSLFSYDTWFPGFNAIVSNIHQMAEMTAFVILVAILIFEIKGETAEGIMAPVFKVVVLAGLISIDAFALNQIQTASLGVSQSILQQPFQQTVNAFVAQMSGGSITGGSGPLSWLFLASNSFTMSIVGAVCFLSGLIVMPILWLVYLFQQGLGRMGWAFLPIFIALIGTKRFSGMGTGYVTSVIAIYLWPIGFAVVLTGTINLLNAQGPFAATQNIPLLNSSPEAVKVLFAAGYTIVGIIAAPFITQKAVTAGGNFGTAAFGTMFGMGQTAASAGAGALTSAGAAAGAAGSASAQQAHNAAVLGKLDQIASGVSGGSGSSSSGPAQGMSRPGFGSPSASQSGSASNSGGSGSAGAAGGGNSAPGAAGPGSSPSLTPQAAVAAARAASSSSAGGGGSSSGGSSVPASWTAHAGGSSSGTTSPSYHQAVQQTGSGDAAIKQLMTQTAFAKPVMS